MASGSISVTTSNQYISGRIDWSSTKDIVNNKSSVTATLYLSRTNTGYTTTRKPDYTITINGSAKHIVYDTSLEFTYNSNTNCGSYTIDVPHNADGTKTCTISLSGKLTGASEDYTINSVSKSVTLDTIPRASEPTLSVSSVNYGSAVTITTNRKSTSFTHTLRYSWNGHSGTIASSVTTSYAWTIPNSFMDYIPNGTSTTGTIYCDTYNGATLIGTKSITLTTNVPSTVVPTFTTITNSEANSVVTTAAIGKYVQGLSKLNLAITGAAGVYSSTISSYQITFEGAVVNAISTISGTIKGSGDLVITGKVTDSRGRSTTKTVTVNVLLYVMPKITAFSISRCNSDGTANDMGTYAKIVTIGSVQSLLNSTEKNNLTYTLYSKARTTQTWTTIKDATTIAGLSLNVTNTLGTYAATDSFDFRLDVKDKFNTTLSLIVLSTGEVTMSWGKTGIGVGKVWENGILDVGGDIYENGTKLSSKYAAYSHNHDGSYVNITGDTLTGDLNFSNNKGIKGKNTTGTLYNIGYIDSANKVSLGTQSLAAVINSIITPSFNIAGTTRDAWHDGNNPCLLSNNGYTKLANGVIIQWGWTNFGGVTFTGTKSQAITFPIAFTSAVKAVIASGYTSVPDKTSIGVNGYSTTGCTIYGYRSDTSNFYIYWIAIGY
jgi:hypothetical protein